MLAESKYKCSKARAHRRCFISFIILFLSGVAAISQALCKVAWVLSYAAMRYMRAHALENDGEACRCYGTYFFLLSVTGRFRLSITDFGARLISRARRNVNILYFRHYYAFAFTSKYRLPILAFRIAIFENHHMVLIFACSK